MCVPTHVVGLAAHHVQYLLTNLLWWGSQSTQQKRGWDGTVLESQNLLCVFVDMYVRICLLSCAPLSGPSPLKKH